MAMACKDSNWMEKILPEDTTLFDDLLNKNEVILKIDTLLKRIKQAQKFIANRLSEEPRETTLVHLESIILTLVSCLWKCSENIRLGRAINKFLVSLWHLNSDLIKSTLTSQLLNALHQEENLERGLTQVSSVLEVSGDVRDALTDDLAKIVHAIQSSMDTLLDQKPVSCLTLNEHKLLYATIKIFQYYPHVISQSVWSHDAVQNDLQAFLKVITSWLIYILQTPGFPVDCVLLSGMTIMFLLNTSPSPGETSSNFWKLFNHVKGGTESLGLGSMKITPKSAPCLIPEHIDSEDNSITFRLGHLSLLRGFVMSATTTTLLFQDDSIETCDKMSTKINLMKLHFLILRLCKGAVYLRYLSFHLLTKWFQKLLQIWTKSKTDMNCHIEESSTTILTETWWLIKQSFDSPVDNVAEFSIEICGQLLEFQKQLVIRQCIENETDSVREIALERGDNFMLKKDVDLVDVILRHFVDTTWTLKSRYKLLRTLIPYTDTEKIRDTYWRLKEDLLLCLSTSNLAVCANDVYKTWLSKDRESKQELETRWITQWWELIESAITSQHSLLRHNAMIYLIPTTLKTAPELADCLQSQINTCLERTRSGKERNRALHAGVLVMKVIRAVTPGFKMPLDSPLREALYHCDDEIRSAALSVICTSLKTAEPLCSIEEDMLRKTLALNLKIDSAAFRQGFMGDVKKLCVRCRDSSLSMMKSFERHKDVLVHTLEFTDWLLRLCVANLCSGASFQRRKTCLEIYQIILQTFTRFHESKHKRGQDQESVARLMEFANNRKLIDLFSAENWLSVLYCVTDSTDEVQNLASNILAKYFPASIPKELPLSPEGAVIEILSHGMGLCNTAWSPDNNSGSLLCELIWKQYICEKDWTFNIQYQATDSYLVSYVGRDKDNYSALKFVRFIVSEIEEGIRIARIAPLQAANNRPIQGFLKLLNALIGEKYDIADFIPADNLLTVLKEISSLCLATSQVMAAILAGGEESDLCVSFAEVASSLESLLPNTQNPRDNDVNLPNTQNPRDNDITLLHSTYRPLLTWCATNTKESMICLGRVIELLFHGSDPIDDHLEMIERLGSEFTSVFTRNRHWGAIDGCRLGFYKYCTSLFSSSSIKLCSLPQQLLRQVLGNLTSSTSASSVTRRSAGLPILIQTIILSEKNTGRTECLTLTMETLLSVASCPLSGEFDQTVDQPQVHAINMLNTLFTDVGLVSQLVTYISNALILVINGFSSSSWAIRNSATQLFSTLITRVFGQKKYGTEGVVFVNSLTVTEFCAHYPDVCPLIVSKLEGAQEDGLHSITHLPTVLFPVLTILSNLAPQTVTNSFSDSVRDIVCESAYSPVFSVRELAAKAYPALLLPSQRSESVQALLRSLSGEFSALKTNHLHGVLLQVEKLLETENNRDSTMAADILAGLLDNDWILFSRQQSCDLVKAKYIAVVLKCWNSFESKEEPLKSLVENLVERCIQSTMAYSVNKSKICDWLYVETTFKLLVCVYDWTSDHVQNHLSAALNVPGLISACFNTFKHCLQSTKTKFEQTYLITCLGQLVDRNIISDCLELIVIIYLKYGSNNGDIVTSDSLTLTLNSGHDPNSTLAAQILEFSAICLGKQIPAGEFKSTEVDQMTKMILSYSKSDSTERQQLSAARSLSIIGTHLFGTVPGKRKLLELFVCRLVLSTLNLLHNIQPEIRKVIGKFVCSLPRTSSQYGKFPSYQTAVCIQLFCDLLISDWSYSNVCVQGLLNRLYRHGELTQGVDQSQLVRETECGQRELCMEAVYIHRTLKAIFEKRSEGMNKELSEHMQKVMADVVTDLEKCCQLMRPHKEALFPHVTGQVDLETLPCCLLLCDLVINITTLDSNTKQRLISALQELSQVTVLSYFHGELLQKSLKNLSVTEYNS